MTADQAAVALLVEIALAVTAVGLLARGRWRLSWFFSAYVPTALLGNVLVTWWPEVFFAPRFWVAKQAIYDLLKLGLAVELSWRAFRVFPGAQALARRAVVMILALTTVGVAAISGAGLDYLTASGRLHPRLLNGTVWLFVTTLALAQWYRVPVHPFHKALQTSFGAYLALFGTLLGLQGVQGWAAQPYLNAFDPPAYLLLAIYWAHLAWRPETDHARAHVETLRKVELRTASCG